MNLHLPKQALNWRTGVGLIRESVAAQQQHWRSQPRRSVPPTSTVGWTAGNVIYYAQNHNRVNYRPSVLVKIFLPSCLSGRLYHAGLIKENASNQENSCVSGIWIFKTSKFVQIIWGRNRWGGLSSVSKVINWFMWSSNESSVCESLRWCRCSYLWKVKCYFTIESWW